MSFKSIIKTLLPGVVSYRNRLVNYLAHYRFRSKSVEEVFDIVYKENHWRDAESISGTGSNERHAVEVIRIVNQVFRDFEISTILDIPCGDFNWMKHVDFKGVKYIGGDIVQLLIEQNKSAFATHMISFEKLNLLDSPLPKVDLIFTRDCLVHLSYSDIAKAVANIKKSGSTYWLATTFTNHKNFNIITGDWRPINLELPPFNLPKPITIYNENCMEDDRYRDKSLALWRISNL